MIHLFDIVRISEEKKKEEQTNTNIERPRMIDPILFNEPSSKAMHYH